MMVEKLDDNKKVNVLTVLCLLMMRRLGDDVCISKAELEGISGELGIALKYNEDESITVFESSGMTQDEAEEKAQMRYDN